MRRNHHAMRRWLVLAFVGAVSCGDGDEPRAPAFESDLPSSASGGTAGRGADAGAAGGDGADDTLSPGAPAERAIVEADIVQVSGDRLYALSRVEGPAPGAQGGRARYGSPVDLAASGSTVVMALGMNGAQHIDL